MLKIICNNIASFNGEKLITLKNVLITKGHMCEIYSNISIPDGKLIQEFKIQKNDIILNYDINLHSSMGLLFLSRYNWQISTQNKIKKAIFIVAKSFLFDQQFTFTSNKIIAKTFRIVDKILYFFNPVLEFMFKMIYKAKIIDLSKYHIPIDSHFIQVKDVQIGQNVGIICNIGNECQTKELIEYALAKSGTAILYGRIFSGLYFYDFIEPYLKNGAIKFAGNVKDRRKIYQDSKLIYINNLYPNFQDIANECRDLGIECDLVKSVNIQTEDKGSIEDLILELCKI